MALRNGGIITQGEYEGKTLEEATKYANDGGFTTRITEENGKAFMLTMDFRTDRINFRVRDGFVIDAYGG
jgi:hypothetical protein